MANKDQEQINPNCYKSLQKVTGSILSNKKEKVEQPKEGMQNEFVRLMKEKLIQANKLRGLQPQRVSYHTKPLEQQVPFEVPLEQDNLITEPVDRPKPVVPKILREEAPPKDKTLTNINNEEKVQIQKAKDLMKKLEINLK